MDVMYINQVGFVTIIDKTIKYRSTIPIKHNTKEELQKSLTEVGHRYNSAKHIVITIDADWEFVLILRDAQMELDLSINPTIAGNHYARIERNNHVIKEIFRAIFHMV